MQQTLTHVVVLLVGMTRGVTQPQVQTWLRKNIDLSKNRVTIVPMTTLLDEGALNGLMITITESAAAQHEFDAKSDLFRLAKKLTDSFPLLDIIVTFPYEARILT